LIENTFDQKYICSKKHLIENAFARFANSGGTQYLKSTAILGIGTCMKKYCGTRYRYFFEKIPCTLCGTRYGTFPKNQHYYFNCNIDYI